MYPKLKTNGQDMKEKEMLNYDRELVELCMNAAEKMVTEGSSEVFRAQQNLKSWGPVWRKEVVDYIGQSVSCSSDVVVYVDDISDALDTASQSSQFSFIANSFRLLRSLENTTYYLICHHRKLLRFSSR
jgi:hypothetical protein